MLAQGNHRFKKTSSDAPGINPRIIVFLFVIVGCCVFLWGYFNKSAQDANAATSNTQKTIITRPDGGK